MYNKQQSLFFVNLLACTAYTLAISTAI